MKKILRHLTRDPVNLSLKGKLFSTLACFCAIYLTELITQQFVPAPTHPFLVASMGASAIILFFIPSSPLAQPWPVIAGQFVAAVSGVFCAQQLADPVLAASLAVGGSIALMLIFRCLHPPGAATALTPVLSGTSITSLGYSFVLLPVLLNTVLLVSLAIIFNRWILKRNYPSPLPAPPKTHDIPSLKSAHQIGISRQETEQALKEMDIFVDMTPSALCRLLNHIESNSFKRTIGQITCRDIMVEDLPSLEFGTEVEDAWMLMYRNKHRALPVLDQRFRVIGIVTWSDFFKFIDLDLFPDVREKFHRFIRRTTKLTTDKPESVGLIMSHEVAVIDETAHIADLIPLMSIKGHRQVPVINEQKQLVGMVFQEHLIASLYNAESPQAMKT